jgi:hypothetical protein
VGTRLMHQPAYERNLATEFDQLKLDEITSTRMMARCETIEALDVATQAILRVPAKRARVASKI